MSTGTAELVRLRVPTFTSHGPQPEHSPGCVDPYTCTSCVPHTLDREQAIARGVRPDGPQPWKPVAPRALRGAAA